MSAALVVSDCVKLLTFWFAPPGNVCPFGSVMPYSLMTAEVVSKYGHSGTFAPGDIPAGVCERGVTLVSGNE